MILIWYNPTNGRYYSKYTDYCNYEVGYTNSYGHLLVSIYIYDLEERRFISIRRSSSYRRDKYSRRLNRQVKCDSRPLNRLTNYLGSLLYKKLAQKYGPRQSVVDERKYYMKFRGRG